MSKLPDPRYSEESDKRADQNQRFPLKCKVVQVNHGNGALSYQVLNNLSSFFLHFFNILTKINTNSPQMTIVKPRRLWK